MTPTAEPSSRNQDAENQESQRPPPHEPQDRQNDERHGASSFVNVINIYIGGSRCQAPSWWISVPTGGDERRAACHPRESGGLETSGPTDGSPLSRG